MPDELGTPCLLIMGRCNIRKAFRGGFKRRLNLVVYEALSSGRAQCCDATLVSLLARSRHPQPCAAAVDGAVLAWPSAASVLHTQKSCGEGHKRWLCSAPSLRGGGPLERPGPLLRARPGASQGVPRPSGRARGGNCRLGAARGVGGACFQYGSGRRLAAAAARRGTPARPCRPRGPESFALAALAQDRAETAAWA